eukprot:CAMPEP_0180834438 /NCGR_PEP_ID=MMETSP1038_2-20121128/77860_1 /TAXON_ID=632150 /ORGANISM="Azadinium spinosum, Strain 3D9" /LENGTH=141 /DNA_ID=CAMNT_0022877679 /DNA_START=67 /DNA_END=490 /DNA_ORIENTATION=+
MSYLAEWSGRQLELEHTVAAVRCAWVWSSGCARMRPALLAWGCVVQDQRQLHCAARFAAEAESRKLLEVMRLWARLVRYMAATRGLAANVWRRQLGMLMSSWAKHAHVEIMQRDFGGRVRQRRLQGTFAAWVSMLVRRQAA